MSSPAGEKPQEKVMNADGAAFESPLSNEGQETAGTIPQNCHKSDTPGPRSKGEDNEHRNSERLGEQRGQGLSSLKTYFPHAASAVAMNTEIPRALGSKGDKA